MVSSATVSECGFLNWCSYHYESEQLSIRLRTTLPFVANDMIGSSIQERNGESNHVSNAASSRCFWMSCSVGRGGLCHLQA